MIFNDDKCAKVFLLFAMKKRNGNGKLTWPSRPFQAIADCESNG